ncbi:hypothetical protein HJC23_011339 [Cyclotella cryptica]|uniref:Endonuclease/exonuclease/phosphatase domain-containing protein n=1 Tax=Cyclotella cryptica TaxID=29204 RepID=A0ABD3QXZ8_9STRA|eukprot:CCRYP_001742-RA/>CCRYP_001742-RA protein AED:0.39 eAED:0.39 QI:0/-1/0/1/-1/1/1/0/617
MMIKKYPNDTPLPCTEIDATSNAKSVSVSSFNLLAPLYIRPIDTRTGNVQPFASFDWISEQASECVLGDDIRLPKLLRRLQNCQCDFICVQELQLGRESTDDILDDVPKRCVSPKQTSKRRSRKEGFHHSDNDFRKYHPSLDTNKPPFVLPNWISPLTQTSTSSDKFVYNVILPEQSELEKIAERNRRVLREDAAVTNAIFYRADKWKPISSEYVNGSTITCVMQAFLPCGVKEQSQRNYKQTQCNRECDDQSADPVVIASIHLDAKSEEKRVQQLQRCLEQCAKVSFSCTIPPIIIAGDYNCELFRGSCVNAFLDSALTKESGNCIEDGNGKSQDTLDRHRGKPNLQEIQEECARALRLPTDSIPTSDQMKIWNELCADVSNFVSDHCLVLRRIDTGTTRVAFSHDCDMIGEGLDTDNIAEGEKQSVMEQWHLDHILYTPFTLAPFAKWSTLEDDEYSTKVGLPNERVPTDHLPVAASFHLRRHPTLNDDIRSRLFIAVNELEGRQRLELSDLQTEVDKIRAELELLHQQKEEASQPDGDDTHKDKKAKKKKGPPAPEIIEHIRKSRAEIKQLKTKHRMERNDFIQDRSVVERMELRSFLKGLCCSSWVENGRYLS